MNLLKFIPVILFMAISAGSQAQILEKIIKKTQKKIENEAEKRTERRINKGVDKVFDKAEQGLDSAVTSDSKTNAKKGSEVVNKEEQSSKPGAELVWSKYDFIPGSEIIFEDNLEDESNGEFPGKWDLVGGTIENANFDNSNAIYFRIIGNSGGIIPMIKNSTEDYLPEEFTVEFDCFFEKEVYSQRYYVNFYAKGKQSRALNTLIVYVAGLNYGNGDISGKYPEAVAFNIDHKNERWRHIAISFNRRALKVYMDDARVLNIPNISENPTGLTLGTVSHKEGKYFIKNIKIAKGAVPLYDKVLTEGKFITTGITFDVNKATIKPESSGTIGYVFKMMQDNPEWNFAVEGHTDSDGSDAFNLTLSEARAKAVVGRLIEMGIPESRLTYKGLGESMPLVGNDTPEGKAKNRRVEFIKK